MSAATPATAAGTPAEPATSDWISIREASAMLGVTPATLRRWAEAGEVATFTTPGGHRRFSRRAIAGRLPGRLDDRADLAILGETTDGIAARYRQHAGEMAAVAPWLFAVPESARGLLREHGRVIAAALLTSVEASGERERISALASGIDAAVDYGRIARKLGASMRQTVATFLEFRRPFVDEMAAVARRRHLDATGTAGLLAMAADEIDRLLDATLEGYEQAVEPDPGPTTASDGGQATGAHAGPTAEEELRA